VVERQIASCHRSPRRRSHTGSACCTSNKVQRAISQRTQSYLPATNCQFYRD